MASVPAPQKAFIRAGGARGAYHLFNDRLILGASYLRMATLELNGGKELYGADALWSWRRAEWSGEWVYRMVLGAAETDEHGGILQAVLPLAERLYFVGRRERYKAEVHTGTATITSLGLTYRPHAAVASKLEYRDGHDNAIVAPSGWLSSFAVLF